jgi:hypothetical protein
MASSNLLLIRNALKEYADKTGIDLPSNPFAQRLETCDSVEEVVGLLEGQMKEFKEYREGNGRLINWLRPVVEVVHNLSDVIGEVVSLVSRLGLAYTPLIISCTSRLPFRPRRQSLLASTFSSRFVYPLQVTSQIILISGVIRLLKASAPATTLWLTSSNVSDISSTASRSIPGSPSPLR